MPRDDDMLGCLGVVRDTQLHMCSYLRAVWVWADSPRFLGNGFASLVAWVGTGRRGKVVSGVVRLD